MSTTTPDTPQRGIASISHLFLSQQQQDQQPEADLRSKPVRTSPTACEPEQPESPAVQTDSQMPATSTVSDDQELVTENTHEVALAPEEETFLAGLGEQPADAPITEPAQTAIVLVGCGSNDDTIDAYKTIKWLKNSIETLKEVALFFPKAPDNVTAEQISDKLTATCRQFLSIELLYLGCQLPDQPNDQAHLAYFLQTKANDRNYVLLSDQIEVALDQQEPLEDSTASLAQPAIKQPIIVDELPQNDCELAQALTNATDHCLPELELPETLDLPLPKQISDSVRIVADATGRVYVLSAALEDTTAALLNALNARDWLCDHIQLVAQASQQQTIDTETQPGIAIIAPAAVQLPSKSLEQLNNCPTIIKHFHTMQIDNRYGLLIV